MNVGKIINRNVMKDLTYQKNELNDMLSQLLDERDLDMANLLLQIVLKSMKVDRLKRLSKCHFPIFRFDHERVPHFEMIIGNPGGPISITELVNFVDEDIIKQSRMLYQALEEMLLVD